MSEPRFSFPPSELRNLAADLLGHAKTLGASDAVLQDMDGDGRAELLLTSLITNRVSLVKNISVPFVNL